LYGLYNINYRYKINDDDDDENINTYMNTNNIYNIKIESNILYSLLTLIGIGSVYFHYELSPFAHWVDIIFISMILVYSQYILCLNSNTNIFLHMIKYIGLMSGHFITSIYIPQIHIFLLFATGFAVKNSIEYKIDKLVIFTESLNQNKLISRYWWIKKYFIIAIVFWIIDYFFCSFITPYHIHWIFHIFIGLVAYKIIDLIRYF
jgi:hypothetical protein